METLSPFGYYVYCLKNCTDFKGRARRREYWFFQLFNTIFNYAFVFLLVLSRNTFLYLIFSILFVLYAFALILPSFAVSIRRYHDSDHSGWWMLCPVVNFIFLFFDSTPGPNRFGSSPKDGDGIPSAASQSKEEGLSVSNLEQLEKLARLRDQGVLTDEEFQEQKKKFF